MGQIMLQTFRRSLWNNGIFVNRDMRNKPGIISNHARGLATDLSYRWQPPKRGRQDGRKVSLAYINKLLQNADTLGIELVIDYAQSRSWRCDRGTWQIGKFPSGDWYHIEVNARLANDPEATKQAFQAVFRPSPQDSTKTCLGWSPTEKVGHHDTHQQTCHIAIY
jgi:hypothetical protein